jgi:hypothetical protein
MKVAPFIVSLSTGYFRVCPSRYWFFLCNKVAMPRKKIKRYTLYKITLCINLDITLPCTKNPFNLELCNYVSVCMCNLPRALHSHFPYFFNPIISVKK